MPTEPDFELFASRFVRGYWVTVKSGAFPMPPDEPVEETLAELLADISYETRRVPADESDSHSHELRMSNRCGDSWRFLFRSDDGRSWELVGASVGPEFHDPTSDLLSPSDSQWFRPFLQHVNEIANHKELPTD